jgi:hypothetical protein
MSSITSKRTKAAALAQVQALIAGTQKHFPSGSFTLGSTAYTTASLVAHAAEEQVGPSVRAYKRLVLAAFSNSAQTLADFGLEPPKDPTPRTAEQKAAAAAKAKATRTARGTTSRKQKLAIKGDVTGVLVTPITAPSSASATPSIQPASNASSEPTSGIASK